MQRLRTRALALRLAAAAAIVALGDLNVAARPQASSSTRIFGVVTDQLGGPVTGATVSTRSKETGRAIRATTDDFGRYTLDAVPVGPTEVRVTKPGFRAGAADINLLPDVSYRSNHVLNVGGLTEQVALTASHSPLPSPAASSGFTSQESALRQQIVRDPNDQQAYLRLAGLYYSQERFSESAAAMELANVLWVAERTANRNPFVETADSDIDAPRPLHRVEPVYPMAARSAGVAGAVHVEGTLTEEGTLRDVRVVRSVPLLDEAVLGAVRQWRYEPVRLRGVPVPVDIRATVIFELKAATGPPADNTRGS